MKDQIRRWLEEENAREGLLDRAIPQKGLEYSDEPVSKGTYFLHSIDGHVNKDKAAVWEGTATEVVSGYGAILSGTDFQKVRYFVPVKGHEVRGHSHDAEGIYGIPTQGGMREAHRDWASSI